MRDGFSRMGKINKHSLGKTIARSQINSNEIPEAVVEDAYLGRVGAMKYSFLG